MTTISDVNIVVQQGNSAREAQNVRTQPLDPNQMTVAQQQEKESEQRTTVSESDESDRIAPDQEKEGRREERQGAKKKAPEKSEAEKDPDAPGRLLDTIA